jgi:hypothetical protein
MEAFFSHFLSLLAQLDDAQDWLFLLLTFFGQHGATNNAPNNKHHTHTPLGVKMNAHLEDSDSIPITRGA